VLRCSVGSTRCRGGADKVQRSRCKGGAEQQVQRCTSAVVQSWCSAGDAEVLLGGCRTGAGAEMGVQVWYRGMVQRSEPLLTADLEQSKQHFLLV